MTKIDRINCTSCGKSKLVKDFYTSYSPFHKHTEKLHVCKQCVWDFIGDDINKLKQALRMIDKAFLIDLYNSSVEEAEKTNKHRMRIYMKNIVMPQYREFTWDDSDFEGHKKTQRTNNFNDGNNQESDINLANKDELIVKWGEGYSDLELQRLEKFYGEMLRANDIQTPQHRAQLELLCKVYLEQNNALSDKKFGDFKNLNMQYSQILRDSGFRPIDRQSGGESAGIRTFSQIWEEIERDGFIKPADIEENQDIVDKTIMYMGNYTRKLLNMNSMSSPPSDTPRTDGDE